MRSLLAGKAGARKAPDATANIAGNIAGRAPLCYRAGMIQPPETIRVSKRRASCDGSGDIPAALGHPRVFLEIDERGYAECGYCDRRFVLIGGAADLGDGAHAA